MCGIAGSIGSKIDVNQHLRTIMDSRGPDDFCFLVGKTFTILHSRLAVIGSADPVSKQPIEADGNLLFCNGFISNYQELLATDGIGNPKSDCHAVLDVYRRFGVPGFSLLRGQFAAAILDSARKRIVLTRDASGITPLYYVQRHGKLLFASQASWLQHLSEETDSVGLTALDAESRDEWNSYGYADAQALIFNYLQEEAPEFALEEAIR